VEKNRVYTICSDGSEHDEREYVSKMGNGIALNNKSATSRSLITLSHPVQPTHEADAKPTMQND